MADPPWGEHAVAVRLRARRLAGLRHQIGLALGGKAGARPAERIGTP